MINFIQVSCVLIALLGAGRGVLLRAETDGDTKKKSSINQIVSFNTHSSLLGAQRQSLQRLCPLNDVNDCDTAFERAHITQCFQPLCEITPIVTCL